MRQYDGTQMATAQPSMSPVITVGQRGRRLAWLLWICVTILGAVIASLAAWRLRLLDPHSVSAQQLVGFIVAVETELLISAGQWLVLRRYRMKADWWIPASVLANVAAALIIVPLIVSLAIATGGIRPISVDGGLSFGILSAAASGLVVATAQALALRGSAGKLVWAWIPATMFGGVFAVVVTNALSLPLIDAIIGSGRPVAVLITVLTAIGALAASACQSPVIVRLVRSEVPAQA
jgi:hypothetical protein